MRGDPVGEEQAELLREGSVVFCASGWFSLVRVNRVTSIADRGGTSLIFKPAAVPLPAASICCMPVMT
jgi:hypothetical protein